MSTVRIRVLTLSVLLVAVFAGIALANEGDPGPEAQVESEDELGGLPSFLEEGAELPPGLAGKEVLPPGLAKKLGDNTPPGQAKKTGDWTPPGQAMKSGDWMPPGLAKKGKIPPGHARRLGVEPDPGIEPTDDPGE